MPHGGTSPRFFLAVCCRCCGQETPNQPVSRSGWLGDHLNTHWRHTNHRLSGRPTVFFSKQTDGSALSARGASIYNIYSASWSVGRWISQGRERVSDSGPRESSDRQKSPLRHPADLYALYCAPHGNSSYTRARRVRQQKMKGPGVSISPLFCCCSSVAENRCGSARTVIKGLPQLVKI